MGHLVDAGIAGHSGDTLVGSWPCIPALVPLLGTRSSTVSVGLIACASIGNTYASEANTPPAKRTRREMQCKHVHVQTQRKARRRGDMPKPTYRMLQLVYLVPVQYSLLGEQAS